jgi:hypothetical protein
MIPTVGRIVHYTLTEHDVERIITDRLAFDVPGNAVWAGQVFPAMIVRVWGEGEGAACNLQVLLDGEDVLWVTSRTEYKVPSDHGTWSEPAKVIPFPRDAASRPATLGPLVTRR